MDADRDRVARIVPDHDLGDIVGRGAFGVVWAATHRELGRAVAVKMLARAEIADRARFRREARVLAALDHANVVRVYDFREVDDRPVIVMELLAGGSLAERSPDRDLEHIVADGRAAALGLAHAHEHGILHRDVKPANLMFDGDGRVRVTDFGVAGFLSETTDVFTTSAGSLVGTPAYLAPEQAAIATGTPAPPVSAASDQYALAVVVYEQLTGELPHDPTGGAISLCVRRVREPARSLAELRPDLPATTIAVIMRALERAPEQRYPSIVAFADALRASIDDNVLATRLAPLPAAPRSSVPAEPRGLVGRDATIAAIEALLDEQAVVSLVAVGGIGKTRVASAIAQRHGATFVDLTNAGPDDVVLTVARAVGLRDASTSSTDAIGSALAGRRALLVLDNCEPVTATVRDLVDSLVRAAPDLRILATSREALDVVGECVHRLTPLDVEAATTLFTARARVQRADFVLDEQNQPVVEEIVRRLDGIPLAIELAAARLRALSVTEIADRLDRRFRLLDAPTRTSEAGRRTLEATIAWSVAQLDPGERAALGRLAVFRGGFDLEGATALLTADDDTPDELDALDQLDRLIDRSLLQRDEGPDGRSRYRALESIRAYALDHLDELVSGVALAELERTHLHHVAQLAERFGSQLACDTQAEANARLRPELDNILHALDTATTSSAASEVDAGLDLAVALRYFWTRNGIAAVPVAALERLLDRTADADRRAAGATVLSRSYCLTGHSAAALALAEDACTTAVKPTTRLRALQSRAVARLYCADIAGGIEDAVALIEASAALGDAVLEGDGHGILAIARSGADELAAARHEYELATELHRHAGDWFGVAWARVNLADCALRQDDLPAAAAYLDEVRPILERFDSPELATYYHGNLGLLALRRGDVHSARHELARAVVASEAISEQQGLLNNLVAYARAIAAIAPERARPLQAAADALADRLGIVPDPNEQLLQDETRALLGGVEPAAPATEIPRTASAAAALVIETERALGV